MHIHLQNTTGTGAVGTMSDLPVPVAPLSPLQGGDSSSPKPAAVGARHVAITQSRHHAPRRDDSVSRSETTTLRANPPVFGSPGPAGRQSVGPVGPTDDRPRRWSNHPRGAREPWSCHLPVDRFLTWARGLRGSRSPSRHPSSCVKILPDMSTTLACDFAPLGRAATNSWCCFRSSWQPRAFPGGCGMS